MNPAVLRARIVNMITRCETAALHAKRQGVPSYGDEALRYARKARGWLRQSMDETLAGILGIYAAGIDDACREAERTPTMAQMRAHRDAVLNSYREVAA